MDKKKACAILGLDEDASMEEIERTYRILFRRKMQQQSEGKNEAEEALFHKYAEAYAFLKGETGQEKQSAGSKIFNFILYHKISILVTIAVLVIAAVIVKTSFSPERTDLNLQICGEVYPRELGLGALGKNIRDRITEIKAIKLGVTPLRHDAADSASITNSNKIFVDIAMGKFDMFILDEFLYEKYSTSGIFMDLGAVADEMSVPEAQRAGLRAKSRNDANEKLYGIDITKSQLLFDSGIAGEKKILVIVERSKKKENALKLLNLFLTESPTYDADTAVDPG